METKHTKGNLKIGESRLSVICDNDYVCTCHHEAEQCITEEQATYNAKLIAAAPELLEFAESYIYYFEHCCMTTCGKTIDSASTRRREMYSKAKQAIKKAME